MTQEVPAEGRLFLSLLQVARESGARHLLIRNYERYPFEFTGDVDLYVELDRMSAVKADLLRVCSDQGWDLLRVVDRPWILALQCVRDSSGGARSAFVVEMFDRFGWLGFPYASFDAVWERGSDLRGMRTLPEYLGMLLTFAHYAYWAGFFPSKYQKRMRAALEDPRFDEAVALVFHPRVRVHVREWLRVYSTAADHDWERRPDVPEPIFSLPVNLRRRLRGLAVLNSLRATPVQATRSVLRLAWLRVRELLAVSGRVLLVQDRGWDVLVAVKKYHLYKNRTSIAMAGEEAKRAIRALARIYWAIARGGIAVVEIAANDARARARVRRVFGRHVRELPSVGSLDEATLVEAAIKELR